MNILHSTHSAPNYIPPPALTSDQIIFSPFYPDKSQGTHVQALQTPKGTFDIAEFVACLPPEQYPDLLVVRADSSGENRPRNIGALRCPSVLIVGDTHHQRRPIQGMVDYALSEPFQAVILDYTRQHAHFFIEAGLSQVYWLPGFNVRRFDVPKVVDPDIPLSFVGHVSDAHPRRQALCQALIRAKLPLQTMSIINEDTPPIHARTQVNFNCSLNGDLNLRVFEVLQSGGLLLSDRLGVETGLELLLSDGEHLVLYDSLKDCVEKARVLLADSARARCMAQVGKARYEQLLAPERIALDFFALVERGEVRPEFDLGHGRRTALVGSASYAHSLRERIAAYEVMQQLHMGREITHALIAPTVDPQLAADMVDLPRLVLSIDTRRSFDHTSRLHDLLKSADLSDRINVLANNDDAPRTVDVIIATGDELQNGSLRVPLSHYPAAMLLLVTVGNEMATEAALASLGYHRVDSATLLFAPTNGYTF